MLPHFHCLYPGSEARQHLDDTGKCFIFCWGGTNSIGWSFRLETGSESIKVVVGALHGFKLPRRAEIM